MRRGLETASTAVNDSRVSIFISQVVYLRDYNIMVNDCRLSAGVITMGIGVLNKSDDCITQFGESNLRRLLIRFLRKF